GGGLSEINGPITIDNEGGQTALTLDDSNVGTPKTATITTTTVTGLAPATIDYTNASLTSLTINGGYGGNTFVVQKPPAGANTTLNAGNGVDTVYVVGTTGPLTVNTQEQDTAGFDSVWIGFGQDGYTLDSIQGAVTVNTIGRPGVDYANLAIDDSAEKSPEQF